MVFVIGKPRGLLYLNPVMNGEDLNIVLQIIGAFLVFAAVHSLLTTGALKHWAAGVFGPRAVKGFYRLFYTVVSFLTTATLLYCIVKLPDRTLWRAPVALATLMHAIQVAGLLLGLAALRRFDTGEFLGTKQAKLYLKKLPIGGDIEGISQIGLVTDGPYRIVRHPMYLAGILIFTFEPNITRNFLTLSLLADLYFIFGALREDRLLQKKFPDFRQYQKRVPLLIPSPGSLLRKGSGNNSN